MKHIVKGFRHNLGKHCESSALRDLFEFHGYPMTEAMAFGLDGTFGFGFWKLDSATSYFNDSKIPFFFGGKQGVIEPNSLACRVLGIKLRKQTFNSADSAWEDSIRHIDDDNPLILQVDLAHLPYFIEESENQGTDDLHFGGHQIVLAGYDLEKKVALVADSDQEGLVEVPIEMLKKGRSSTFGPSFMHPKNAQISMKSRDDGKYPPFAAGVKLCIQHVVNNMLRSSLSSGGLQGLKNFIGTIPNWKESMANTNSEMVFKMIYGYIEEWGTGGASFRNLYVDFLNELTNHSELKNGIRAWNSEEFSILETSILYLNKSIQNWNQFSKMIASAVEEFQDLCLEKINLEQLHSIGKEILVNEEIVFTELAKIKL